MIGFANAGTLIAAFVLAAAVENATPFAPPIDRAFRYVIVETRDEGGAPRRFTIERKLTFHRDDSGFFAELTVVRTDAGSDAVGQRFVAGTRALLGRTIRFHLDANGTVTAIDDLDNVWAAMMAGVAPIGTPSRLDAGAAMRTLPADRALKVMSSMLSPVVASTAIPTPVHPVRLSSGALPGRSLILDGAEAITRGAGGLHIETHASGESDGTTLRIDRASDSDPGTGLIRRSDETQSTIVAGRTSTKTITITVEPLVI